MKTFAVSTVAAFALMGLATPALGQTPTPATASARTPGGAIYTPPAGWTAKTNGGATIYTAPEGNLDVAVIDIGKVAGAQAAVTQAWKLYRADAARTQRLATPAPAGDGWEERVSFSYETSPSEKVSVSALALRKGEGWTVIIVEGADATVGKRSAAAAIIQQSIRPAGYTRETFVGRTAHRLTPDRVQLLRDFIADSAKQLEVPGVGFALVDQGKVVWQGGIGVRELGKPELVDEHTKFMIGSNTKGMATLLLSALADEGKLRWDQKVVDLYPRFRLGDAATTQSVLVRHLVCACTGLPRKDFSFILAEKGAPASDTFRQLAVTQPTSKFGELFQYNNLMASAAGYLGGHLAYPKMELGAAFDRAMDTRIFKPLGMVDSTFDNAKGMSGDWAKPHGFDIDGRMVTMSNDFNMTVYPHRPAGGAWSTTADMVRYVQLELSKGVTPEGKRMISEANIVERRKPGVSVSEDSRYGMGLFERVAWGVPVVTHGGTLRGYHATFYVLPEAGVGAVILTNADTGPTMFSPFLRRLLEVMYDGKPEAVADVAAAATRTKRAAGMRRTRLTFPGDTAVLGGLAKRYRNPEVGSLTISDRDGGKWVQAGYIEGPLATRKNADGSMSIVSAGPGNIPVDAVVGTRDGKRTLTMRDSQNEYVYTEE